MSDFAVNGGLFSRALGVPELGRRRGEEQENRNALGTGVSLSDSLKLNSHKRPLATQTPTPAPGPETDLDLAAESSTDQLVRGYVAFLKSIQGGETGTDVENALERAQELIHVVTDPLGIADSEIESLNITSSFSLAEVYEAYAATDGTTSIAGASYAASASARLQADIVTKDGRAFHVEISLDAQVSIQAELTQSNQPAAPNQADPLALDLDGDGQISLSDVQNGIAFDINADGVNDQSAFVRGADAFLAFDRNGNGNIDNGAELFGDQHGANNGFEELSKFDDDENGRIDAQDGIYSQLLAVSRDASGELFQRSISSLGIESLSLGYYSTNLQTDGGNTISEVGSFFRSSSSYQLADIKLGYGTLSKEA